MPRKNEYTWVIEVPMTRSAAMRHAKFFAEMDAKKAGFTAEVTVRELRPGEEYHLIQQPEDIQAVG